MTFIPEEPDNYFRRRNRIIRERKKLAKKRVKELRDRPTRAESKLKSMLEELNVKHVFQKPFISEWTFSIADFYFPHKRLIIEVDGSIHDRPDVAKKDKGRSKFYKKKGYKLIRLRNEEVMKMSKRQLMSIINKK